MLGFASMEIRFAKKDLRSLCEDRRQMVQKLGSACAKKLQARLSDLCAAARLGEVTAGKPHPLLGDRAGQFALSLQDPKRLVFEPAGEDIPRTGEGNIDWEHLTKITIVFIGDYHD